MLSLSSKSRFGFLPALALLGLLSLGACQSDPSTTGASDTEADAGDGGGMDRRDSLGATLGDSRVVRASELSSTDRQEFKRAWKLFLDRRPTWPYYRDAWLQKGGAAPFVLAENLYLYFWSVAMVSNESEISRVAATAEAIGEPAVAYFAKTLVLDQFPLKEPVTVEIADPENFDKRIKRTYDHFTMDDKTRKYAARVLARIGEPAVPTLASRPVLVDARPTSRRYGAYALGLIGGPNAAKALMSMLRGAPDWQDRAAAAKALGPMAKSSTEVAQALERALQGDPDTFVRKKAAESLAGQSQIRL